MGNEKGFIRVDVDRSKRNSAIEALKELVEAKPLSFTGVYEIPRGSNPSEIWVEYTGPKGSSEEAYNIIAEELGKKELGLGALTINQLVSITEQKKE